MAAERLAFYKKLMWSRGPVNDSLDSSVSKKFGLTGRECTLTQEEADWEVMIYPPPPMDKAPEGSVADGSSPPAGSAPEAQVADGSDPRAQGAQTSEASVADESAPAIRARHMRGVATSLYGQGSR